MQAVFRIEKLKSWGEVGAAGAHNLRLRETKNANPNVKNIEIVGPPPGVSVVEYAKEKLTGLTIRKNAVLAVEAIVSASPEYFRPKDPARAGYYEQEKLDAWRKEVEPWLKKNFPHALSIVLHLDESTPHYQIIDLPLDARGKLNCREKFGSPGKMAAWQTSVAKAMAPLGIERGVEGSTAEHTKIAEFYEAVNTPNSKLMTGIPEVKTPKPKALSAPTITERIPGTAAHAARVSKEEKQKAQLAARAEEEQKRKAAQQAALDDIKNKSKFLDISEKQKKAAVKNAIKVSKENASLRAELSKIDADRLRRLPLGEVLSRMYGAKLSQDSKETYTTKKYSVGDESFAVTTKPGGEVWFDQRQSKGGKGAIDLVMHIENASYKEAIKLLSDTFGSEKLSAEVEHVPPPSFKADQIVAEAIKAPAPVPTHAPTRWPRVKAFLIEQRKLPEKLVDWLRKLDRVRADYLNNAVFPRSKDGAFVRGTGSTKFHRTYGGKEAGPFTLPGAAGGKVILCEGAIDACSLKALNPSATVHALGGNLLRPADVRSLVPEGAQVLLAFDADAQGEQFNKEAKSVWPNAEKLELPTGAKDWNAALQSGAAAPDMHWQSDAQKRAQEAAKAAAEAEQRQREQAEAYRVRMQAQRTVASRPKL
jgi:5S rRNA maturation endonuclease (ribonuclease M5)